MPMTLSEKIKNVYSALLVNDAFKSSGWIYMSSLHIYVFLLHHFHCSSDNLYITCDPTIKLELTPVHCRFVQTKH